MPALIAMVDLGIGNLQSVQLAFERVGFPVRATTRAEDVDAAGALILPGVGAFNDGAEALRRLGLVEPIRRHALERRRPLLGICLGMQLLADEGEEHGVHAGLGLVPGRVVRLQPTQKECRVPNMGWCDVEVRRASRVLGEAGRSQPFYFAHSFHLVCAAADDAVATIDYGGQPVTAAVERDNLFGVQFHPEKSQDGGLDLLHAFCREAAA